MSKLRKRLTIILLAVFASLLTVAVTGFTTKAKAADINLDGETFEIADKVSLKLNEDGGMRWILKVSDNVYNYVKDTEGVEMGFVIAPKVLMDRANGDYYGMAQRILIPIDLTKGYQDTGTTDTDWYFNGCVVKMNDVNRKYDYTAAAYIKSGDTILKQTTINTNSVNNFYNVANKSILYSVEDYSEKMLGLESYNWLGTENYPIMVSDAAQYETLKSRQTNGFQDKYYEFSSDLDYKADDFSELGNNISRYGVETAPVSKKGLAYTGSAQKLVEAGVAVGTNCKILYKLGDGEWSETTPAATNAGEYTIYYKGVSGSLETAEKSVTVIVDKAKNAITYDTDANGDIVGLDFVYGNKPNETSAKAIAGDITYTYTLVSKNSTGNVVEPDVNAKYLPWSDDNISGIYKCLITASETENYKAVVADRWVRVHKAENAITYDTDENDNILSLDFTFGEKPIQSTAKSIAGDLTYTYTKVNTDSWGSVAEPDANAKYLPWSDDNTPGVYKCLITAAETDNYKSVVSDRWVRFHKRELDENGVKYAYNTNAGVYYVSHYEGSSTEITVPDTFNDGANGEKAVKYVGFEAFKDNAIITKVILPSSVDSLEGSAFLGCTNLEYVSMTGVKTMNWASVYNKKDGDNNFRNCNKLRNVIIGSTLSSNCGQFNSEAVPEPTILEFFVNGTAGNPNLEGNNALWTGNVYYKADDTATVKCMQWKFGENGEIVKGASSHTFVDGKCSGCGKVQTEGLLYALDEEQDCYYVSGYNGSDKEIYVLSEYNGKPVTYIKNSAFFEKTDITKVILPTSIKRLDGGVFQGCGNLEYVSMLGIEEMLFAQIDVPYSDAKVTTNNNFIGCTKLTVLIVGEKFNLHPSGESYEQQFLSQGNPACIDVYVYGTSVVNCSNGSDDKNGLLTGNVYYYSETESENSWRYVDGVATKW